jgi:predicted nucleic acid-binding protein
VTYLPDTNVLPETRKRQPNARVTHWITESPPQRMHVSVLTLGEIEQGIARIRERGDQQQAAGLERWLYEVERIRRPDTARDALRGVRLGTSAVRTAASRHRRADRGDG